jgi:hypothetical protein
MTPITIEYAAQAAAAIAHGPEFTPPLQMLITAPMSWEYASSPMSSMPLSEADKAAFLRSS